MNAHITASEIRVDSADGRIVLLVDSDEDDTLTIDVHGIALELYAEIRRTLDPYVHEAEAARATMPPAYEPGEAYSTDDPKHPDWHDAMAAMWDNRKGK